MRKIVQIKFCPYYKNRFGIYTGTEYTTNGNIVSNHISLKGKTIYPLLIGRCYEIEGEEKFDAKYGRTFEFSEAYEIDATNFDFNCFIIYEQKRASEARRFPRPSIKQLEKELKERISEDRKVKELTKYNILFLDAQKLVDEDNDILEKILEDPYILLDIANDFTFEKCDKIAAKCHLNPDSSHRIRTGIRETIKEVCYKTGNSYVTLNETILNMVIKKLNYYLTKQDVENIKKQALEENTNLIDFKVYDFFEAAVFVDNIDEQIKNKEPFFIIDKEKVMKEFDVSDKKFTVENDKFYLTELRNAEKDIVTKIKSFEKNKTGLNKKDDIDKKISIYENKNSISLNDKQKEAIYSVLKHSNGGFYILTGVAGTGKTTVVDAILNINFSLKRPLHVAVAAPTGKATKVLRDSITVNVPVETVHSLLGYSGNNDFFYTKLNHLPYNFIIVDETSMLDLDLASSLVNAIEDGTKVLFLGDVRQLPSIGPGRVLDDLMKCLPNNILELTEICRQKNGSGIIENSNNILMGKEIKSSSQKDNYVIWAEEQNVIENRLKQSLAYLKSKCNFTNEDIEILSPMKIGNSGTYALNHMLQSILNPTGYSPIEIEEYNDTSSNVKNIFKIGDKIINIKNNYRLFKYQYPINEYNVDTYMFYCTDKILLDSANVDKNYKGIVNTLGIANGETGYITDMFTTQIPKFDAKGRFRGTEKADCITVKFDDGYVCFINSIDIRLGYCVSIHKSQGSGWKGVISIIGPDHQHMACNELMYVANTRAREKNIFICSKDIYEKGVKRHLGDRASTLKERYNKNI